jgi:molybdopterin synthase sulfur carrier subunit
VQTCLSLAQICILNMNMSTKIVIPSFLKQFTGNSKEFNATGSTVGECLNDLIKHYPGIRSLLLDENGRLRTNIDVFVNGQSSYPEELNKPVHEGDEFHIAYVMVGG